MPGDPDINEISRLGGTDMLLLILLQKVGAVEFDENDVVRAGKLMVEWPGGWRPASEFASVRFKRRGWVDIEGGAHPDVYELAMRERGEDG